MAKTHNPWHMNPGISNVGSFQVSGQPFAEGQIDASTGTGHRLQFPQVTQWVQIYNYDNANDCRVGFSSLGIQGTSYAGGSTGTFTGTNFFMVPASGSQGPGISPVLKHKDSELHLKGSDDVHVVAGLTNILPRSCSGSTGPSWSGSAGVG